MPRTRCLASRILVRISSRRRCPREIRAWEPSRKHRHPQWNENPDGIPILGRTLTRERTHCAVLGRLYTVRRFSGTHGYTAIPTQVENRLRKRFRVRGQRRTACRLLYSLGCSPRLFPSSRDTRWMAPQRRRRNGFVTHSRECSPTPYLTNGLVHYPVQVLILTPQRELPRRQIELHKVAGTRTAADAYRPWELLAMETRSWCGKRQAYALFLAHFGQRQLRCDGDHFENRVLGAGRHTQGV